MENSTEVYDQTNNSKNVETREINPIISLSDGDEDVVCVEKVNATKKRSSLGDTNDDYLIKRRKLRVAGAPKMPLTGYVRYMNERREILRKELPNKTAMEHTKIIGEEWQQLSEDRKGPYMKAAAEDRERYTNELNNFLKLHPDILESERAKIKASMKNKQENKNVLKEKPEFNGKTSLKESNKCKETTNHKVEQQQTQPTLLPPPTAKRASTPVHTNNTIGHTVPGEIPIFTNEFLEHNKVFDTELRTLRKSKTDLEQQNAVLEKHVENMLFGVEKLKNENHELQKKNRLLEIFLTKLKHKLATALSGLAIPSEPNGATVENIEKYMSDLHKMTTSNTHGPASLNKAKDIIRKLDLEIQL